MNNQPAADQDIGLKIPSAIPPSDRDKIQPIRYWQERYERYLESIGRKETRRRYARAIERFLGKYPGKKIRPPVPPPCDQLLRRNQTG